MNLKYKLNVLLTNRHWQVISKYITFRKFINSFNALLSHKLGISKIKSYPFIFKVETTDVCNLRCPSCHDGSMPRLNKFMDFNLYKRMIDELKNNLLEVILYHQGEPLIDKKIIDYIEYAHNQKIGTIISTNLSMNLDKEKIENLILSGLDYLIVAIDGVTQETYGKKRIGGNLSKVIYNLNYIIKMKQKLGSQTPFIEWQMVDFPFNKTEQAVAESFADKIGIDRFQIKPSWDSTIFNHKRDRRKKNCPLLWVGFTMLANGTINACNNDFIVPVAALNGGRMKELWNSESYRHLRKTHKTNKQLTCSKCSIYDKE